MGWGGGMEGTPHPWPGCGRGCRGQCGICLGHCHSSLGDGRGGHGETSVGSVSPPRLVRLMGAVEEAFGNSRDGFRHCPPHSWLLFSLWRLAGAGAVVGDAETARPDGESRQGEKRARPQRQRAHRCANGNASAGCSRPGHGQGSLASHSVLFLRNLDEITGKVTRNGTSLPLLPPTPF